MPVDIWGQSYNVPKNGLFGFTPPKGEKEKYERIPLTKSQKEEILFRQKDKCAWAGCRVHFHRDGVPPHFDHKKRVDKGGKSSISNIQALCPNHHQKKTHGENLKEAEKSRKKAKKKESGNPFVLDYKPPKGGAWGF